jgi:hypothetical protein
MAKSSPRSTQLLTAALSFAFLSVLVLTEYLLFQRFLGRNTYASFWIEQGPLIAFSFTLIGLVWRNIDKQHPDLVSAHPGFYLAACSLIMSGVFLAFRNSLPARRSLRERRTGRVSAILLLCDTVMGLMIYALLTLVAFVWLLCIAPTMYFVTLVTGAPARLAMLSKSDQVQMVRSSKTPEGATANEWFVLSFGDIPITVTGALTAGLLTLLRASGIALGWTWLTQ